MRYRAANSNSKYPVHAIVASYIHCDWARLPRLAYETWVDEEEAVTFVNILNNTGAGMRSPGMRYQYQLKLLDEDSKPKDGTVLGWQEFEAGKRNAWLFLESWLEDDKKQSRRHGIVCKMKLDNASSWGDLKKFILSCNYAVMAKEIDEWQLEDIETGTSISKQVLAGTMEVSEANIAHMHKPGTGTNAFERDFPQGDAT